MGYRLILKTSVIAVVLLGASCGGSGDGVNSTEVTRDNAGTALSETTILATGVDGPIVTRTFGLSGINRDTGDHTEIDVPSEFINQNEDPIVGDQTAYALGFDQVEGQSFTQNVTVIKIDLTNSKSELLIDLGQTRLNDDSQDSTNFKLAVVAGSDPWIIRDESAVEGQTLERYDGQSGELLATIPLQFLGKVVADDEHLYFKSVDGISQIDLATNAVELIKPSGLEFRDVDPDLDLTPFILTKSGKPAPEERRDFLLGLDVDVSDFNTLAAGGGRVWFIMSHYGISFDDESAIAEAVVEFDPATRSVVALHPLNGLGGRFLPEEDLFDVSTLAQAGLMFRDGYLFIADANESGKLLKLDPASGIVSEFYDPTSPEYDWHEFGFIETDPAGLWLRVTQATVTEQDEEAGTRSSSLQLFAERIDPETGEVLVSVPYADLNGF